MTTIHTKQLQQYAQDNYNNSTRQLQQYTHDNYKNMQKATNNNTHKTATTRHTRHLEI